MDSKLELLHKVWGNLKNFSEMKPCTLDNMSRDAPAFLKGIAAVSFVDKNDQVRLDSFISIHLLISSASISHNLVQRCIDNLRKHANVERRFTVHEKRVSELGTDVWHGLRPIDSKREFVRYTLPGKAVVPKSDHSYGDLLVTGGDNFTRFHSDFQENTDSLITFYGAGQKVWFFSPGGRVGKRYEKTLRDIDSFYQFS